MKNILSYFGRQSIFSSALLPSFFLLLVINVISLATLSNSSPVSRRAPLQNQADPFYDPPSNIESLALGAIIRTRLVTAAQNGTLSENVQMTYQLLYRTVTANNGSAQANVVTLFVPNGYSTDEAQKGPKLVLHSMAYDASSVHCGPSYEIQEGSANDDADNTDVEYIFINYHLSKGALVATADYEGPQAGYPNGPLSAFGNLDALRAVLNFQSIIPTDVKNQTKIALEGYSGGALATSWAVQYMQHYAPELVSQTVGAAFGGLPVSVSHIMIKINNGSAAALLATAMVGLANVDYRYHDWAKKHSTIYQASMIKDLETHCAESVSANYENQDIIQRYYGISAEQAIRDLPLQELTLGGNGTNASSYDWVPKFPLYIYQGLSDEIVLANDTDAYVQEICQAGAPSVNYIRVPGASHSLTAILSAAPIVDHVHKLLDGNDDPVQGCAIQTTDLFLLTPENILTLGEVVIGELESLI